MENPLLVAIQSNEFDWIAYYSSTHQADLKEHILDLLERQREKCGDIVADSSASLYETQLEEKVRSAKLF